MKDDLIRRGKIGNDIALYMAENAYLNDTALDVLKMIAKWVDEQPAVDAVSIEEYETMKADRDSWKDAFFEFNEIAVKPVRCKDCIFKKPPRVYGNSIIDEVHCGILGVPMNFNDFCSYGERREDNGEIQKETR